MLIPSSSAEHAGQSEVYNPVFKPFIGGSFTNPIGILGHQRPLFFQPSHIHNMPLNAPYPFGAHQIPMPRKRLQTRYPGMYSFEEFMREVSLLVHALWSNLKNAIMEYLQILVLLVFGDF